MPLQISRQILIEQSALRDICFNVRFGDIIQCVLRAATSSQTAKHVKNTKKNWDFTMVIIAAHSLLRVALVASYPET